MRRITLGLVGLLIVVGCGNGGGGDDLGAAAPLTANSLPTPTVAVRPVCRHLSSTEVAARLPGTFAMAESEHGRLPSCRYTAAEGVLELDVVIGPASEYASWSDDATFAHEPADGIGDKATFNYLEAGFTRVGSTSAVAGSNIVVARIEVDAGNAAVGKETIQAVTADVAKVVISRL